jgi:hypothetical protein
MHPLTEKIFGFKGSWKDKDVDSIIRAYLSEVAEKLDKANYGDTINECRRILSLDCEKDTCTGCNSTLGSEAHEELCEPKKEEKVDWCEHEGTYTITQIGYKPVNYCPYCGTPHPTRDLRKELAKSLANSWDVKFEDSDFACKNDYLRIVLELILAGMKKGGIQNHDPQKE